MGLIHWGDATMNILVVQDNTDLGEIWSRFLTRRGMEVDLASTEAEAIELLSSQDYDCMIVEPALKDGGGIPVTDFATYRNPDISILAVTKSTFFSDGSIFAMIPNARGFLRTPVRPDDIGAYMDHFRDMAAARAQRMASSG